MNVLPELSNPSFNLLSNGSKIEWKTVFHNRREKYPDKIINVTQHTSSEAPRAYLESCFNHKGTIAF
jgi:hypothetical protein